MKLYKTYGFVPNFFIPLNSRKLTTYIYLLQNRLYEYFLASSFQFKIQCFDVP